MDFEEFINTTHNYDTFEIIHTNNNGTCCYDSILKLLKLHKKYFLLNLSAYGEGILNLRVCS